MAHDGETAGGGQLGNTGSGLSRRHFVHGTAVAAGAAALLGRIPLRAALRPAALGTAATGALFSLVQAGPSSTGAGSVTVSLPAASTAGTLLVATITSIDPATPVTAPAGWRRAKAIASPGSRAEIWYYAGDPGEPGNPGGVTSATFTGTPGMNVRGSMSEFNVPQNTSVVLESVGGNSAGSGASFPVSSACGNVAGVLGIAAFADAFSTPPTSGSWSRPAGWTALRTLGTGVTNGWASYYNSSLAEAYQSVTGGFSGTANQVGWAAALATFRARQFVPINVFGAEHINMVALDPTSQVLVCAGDVEGTWRTADFGDHWQGTDTGKYSGEWICTAGIFWSQLEPGRVYACVGKTGGGGFLVSADGGNTWQMRSQDVQYQANVSGSPVPRPATIPDDADRSTGDLLAQDPVNGYLYTATYNGGVARSNSTPPGASWTVIGLSNSSFYPRTIAINPSAPAEIWVGGWDSDGTGTYGGVWHTADARSSSPKWNQVSGFTGTVSDLTVVGGYLYMTSDTQGIYRHQIGGAGWTPLNGPFADGSSIDTSKSIWTTIAGYAGSSGSHVIIAGCGTGVKTGSNPNYTNIVKLTIPSGWSGNESSITYADLTGPATITNNPIPPDGQTYWHWGSSYSIWLGGKDFRDPHLTIDPNNTENIYLSGSGGVWRSNDRGRTWSIAVNGQAALAWHDFQVDPNDPNHVIAGGSDYTTWDLTDPTGWNASDVNGVGSPVGSGQESHCMGFDPADSTVYQGFNTKYGKNEGGAVWYRSQYGTAWTDTEYAKYVTPLPGGAVPAPIGLFAGRDSAGKYLVVVTQGAGVWRGVPSGSSWAWTQVDTGIGTQGSTGMTVPFTSRTASFLYLFDRRQGVYRSSDYGRSWTQIWAKTCRDVRSGWLRVNPNVAGQLWAGCDDNLYELSGAGSGTVGNGITLTPAASGYFPYGAGGVAVGPDGTVYAVGLAGASQPGTSLMASSDGTTWANIDDGSIASYVSSPKHLEVTPAGLLLLNTDENVGVYGYPAG